MRLRKISKKQLIQFFSVLTSLFLEKVLTNAKKIDIIVRQATKRRSVTEKYSSGRRGAPAKGVGRVFPARESKSLLLRQKITAFEPLFFYPSRRLGISLNV